MLTQRQDTTLTIKAYFLQGLQGKKAPVKTLRRKATVNGHQEFTLLPTVHKKVSNAFWTIPKLPFKMKRNVFNYLTGTLFNQKRAVRLKMSSSLEFSRCGEPDSALHILSG
eukprot:247186-Pelagomonas_calceolata.AAC.1